MCATRICAGKVESPADKKEKANFATPIATRVSRAFGPVSEHLTAQILPQMSLASRASRPGLAVGLSRVLCSDMCSAQRFEQRCRACCLDEPDSLALQ